MADTPAAQPARRIGWNLSFVRQIDGRQVIQVLRESERAEVVVEYGTAVQNLGRRVLGWRLKGYSKSTLVHDLPARIDEEYRAVPRRQRVAPAHDDGLVDGADVLSQRLEDSQNPDSSEIQIRSVRRGLGRRQEERRVPCPSNRRTGRLVLYHDVRRSQHKTRSVDVDTTA